MIDKNTKNKIEKEEPVKLTPTEYFNKIKGHKHEINSKELEETYDNALKCANKYMITGQTYGLEYLMHLLNTLDKEKKVIDAGITTYLERKDVEEYIENVADKCVKIIEMSQFERDIPDDIIEKLIPLKELFDEFYIIFTDYTGEDTKKVKARERDKDPILIGNVEIDGKVTDRMYYIADWVDDYCDLTLEKMVSQMKSKKNKDIKHNLKLDYSYDELKEMIAENQKNEK